LSISEGIGWVGSTGDFRSSLDELPI